MKVHLVKAIFVNRAPFDKLELDFNENEISVLTAINGRGKTTIQSHIVDALYEMAKPNFPNEFEEKKNKFYRVSSSLYNLVHGEPSYVYLRFKTEAGIIDYLDVRNKCTIEEYDAAIKIEGKIAFSEFSSQIQNSSYVRKISSNFDSKNAKLLFSGNILTFFPSYRFEMPGYLNDIYKINIDFKKEAGFNGYLTNPIEVVTGLPQLANWIMDIVLDLRMNSNHLDGILFQNLNSVISNTLISKKHGALRFGVGPRGHGGTRLQILKNFKDGEMIYPSIFNLSSGESSILCLFGELLRQADNLKNNIQLEEITGIVIIDEVDKHLHITLQKEVLPVLFNFFPNVQFIVSSHSPFFSMGLADVAKERSRIIDLDNLGISVGPISNELYKEVYDMMICENDRFKELYTSLERKIQESTVPLIITEGKTDIQHIKKAKAKLGLENCDIEFHEMAGDWGDSKLKALLEQLSKINQTRKIIGIFDRDVPSIVNEIEKDGRLFKDYTNNVYAFCIPVPNGRENYTNISIEFYYSDIELKKEKDGKRLYFDNELNFNKKREPISSIASPEESFEKKICCENIGGLSWIHSKSRFADLIENDNDFISDFNFANFNLVFGVIQRIVTPSIVAIN